MVEKPLFDTCCMNKLMAQSAQVGFWSILLNRLSLNLESSGGPSCQSWSSVFFYKYSVGFKSGDWLGHSNNFIFFLWNQFRVSFAVYFGLLSCWKVHSRLIILADGNRFVLRISWYMAPFNFPSIIWILPVPWEEK